MREDPKWNIGRPCVQDHEHVVINNYYTTTVLNITPFNVPKIGEEIEIVLDKVISVLVGAVLWNPTIGSLLIKSFNRDSSSVVITSDNLLVDYGKSVLANTEFLIGIPDYNLPTEDDYLNAPYLAADFISPQEGSCQNASVTTVAGIDIGNKVSVSGYVYRVGAIIDKATLKLCNDGEGAPEGTVLAWDTRDCGKPSVPVVVYSSSPCEATPVQTGSLVVCKDKALTTLSGEADGQMIRWNNNHKRWELVNAYIDENCTYLTTCLTIDIITDEDFTYLANVKSTKVFNKEDKVIIEDAMFIVTEIVSSTQMRIRPENIFTTITTYPSGTNVCLEPCCAWVPEKIRNTIDDENWRPYSLQNYIENYGVTIKTKDYGEVAPGTNPLKNLTSSGKYIKYVNYDKTKPCTVSIRMYECISGEVANPDSGKTFLGQLKTNIRIVTTHLDSNNNEHQETEDCFQSDFQSIYMVNTGHAKPVSFLVCQEKLVMLSPYNEEHEAVSTAEITFTDSFDVLTNSELNFKNASSSDFSDRNIFETRIYIQGNYNETIQL